MGIIKLKIVDEKDEEILVKDLTSTGIEMLQYDINQLQEKIDEYNNK